MSNNAVQRRAFLTASLFATASLTARAQSRPVEGVVLSNDAWPRATRLAEWTSDVMRISGAADKSETVQAKAFFEWLRLFSRMAVGGMIQAYEGPFGKESYVLDAHKQLFVYGWGFCDTSSRIAEAAWQEYKRDARSAERVCVQHDDGGYHTMYRLRLDGRYAAFDPRYGYYLVERDAPDARILDWAELTGKFPLNRGYRYRARPFFEIAGLEWDRALLLHPAYFESEAAWRAAGAPKEHVFGDGAYTMGTALHDMSLTLQPGMTIERYWDNSARKFHVPANPQARREWPFLASGRFYRVTETSHQGNWAKFDPNYQRARPYLSTVPAGEGYPSEVAGGRTIGQAYGVIEYRPVLERNGGDAIVDVRSPFVLVDGTLSALPDASEIAIRTLAPKPRNAAEPDQWSPWQTLATGPSGKEVELGRPRFNASDVSIHGKYRFQLRLRKHRGAAPVVKLYFENGIMSIPPLFAGRNTLRFRVADASALQSAVTVAYRYTTASGERTVQRVLRASDFRNGEATFELDAPGLLRCRSVAISYLGAPR